jgi:hypothetical protein
MGGKKGAGADVVDVRGEEGGLIARSEVKGADSGIVARGEDARGRRRGEERRPDRPARCPEPYEAMAKMCDALLVLSHSAQNGAGANVENLDQAIIVTGDDELAIVSDVAAPRIRFEAGDGLDDARRLWAVDLNACSRGNGIAMRF